jgi:hypothetical protein
MVDAALGGAGRGPTKAASSASGWDAGPAVPWADIKSD